MKCVIVGVWSSVVVSVLLAVVYNSAHTNGEYLLKKVYQTTDCSGAAPWITVTLNTCTEVSANTYQITNCSVNSVKTLSTLSCSDATCTNCSSVPLQSCYVQGGGSSNYECIDAVPQPPEGSYVEEKFEGENCSDTTLFFQSYAKGYCIAGNIQSTSYFCSDEGDYVNVTTCQDTGTCTVNCVTNPQNLGCSLQNSTNNQKSVRISCTSGNAAYTTGSSTSSSGFANNTATTTTMTTAPTAGGLTTGGASTISDAATTGDASTTSDAATISGTSSLATTGNAISGTTGGASGGIVTTTGDVTTGGDEELQVFITNITQNSAVVEWELKPNNIVGGQYYFLIELVEGSNQPTVIYNGTGTSFTVTNLQPQTNYTVDVKYYGASSVLISASMLISFYTSAEVPVPVILPVNKSDTGLIVGVVVGIVLGILIIGLIVFFLLQKRKQKKKKQAAIELDYGVTSVRKRATIGIASIGTGYSLRDLQQAVSASGLDKSLLRKSGDSAVSNNSSSSNSSNNNLQEGVSQENSPQVHDTNGEGEDIDISSP